MTYLGYYDSFTYVVLITIYAHLFQGRDASKNLGSHPVDEVPFYNFLNRSVQGFKCLLISGTPLCLLSASLLHPLAKHPTLPSCVSGHVLYMVGSSQIFALTWGDHL